MVKLKDMKSIPIQDYLDHEGISYTREHQQLRSVEHDSLVFSLKKNLFYWNSRQQSGDLGNFIAAWHNLDKNQAWRAWQTFSEQYLGEAEHKKAHYQSEMNMAQRKYHFDWGRWPLESSRKARWQAETYLITQRGLNPDFVREMRNKGVFVQALPRKNRNQQGQLGPMLFPWRDESGKVVGADIQGTIIDYQRYPKRGTEKRSAAGSNEQYGHSFTTGNGADKLIIFEAPIDALSYAQMHWETLQNENATLFSLSGTKHEKVLPQLQRMMAINGQLPHEVIGATDNDQAGHEVAKRIMSVDYEQFTWQREIPSDSKDWNDALKSEDFNVVELNSEQVRTSEMPSEAALGEQQPDQSEPSSETPMEEVVTRKEEIPPSRKDRRRSKQRNSKRRMSRQERKDAIYQRNEELIHGALKRVREYEDDPKEIKRYLDFIAQGLNYSAKNTRLIYAQRPDATLVMGYQQFQKHGIQVNKGETGIRIYGEPEITKFIALSPVEEIKWSRATPEQRQAAEAGKFETFEKKWYPHRIVFDIKQTNAKEADLPKLLPNRPITRETKRSDYELHQIYQVLKDFAQEHEISVYDQELSAIKLLSRGKAMSQEGIAKGVFVRPRAENDKPSIILRPDLPITDRIGVLAHELGHASLHVNTEKHSHPRHIKELQAEMTSYVVLKHLGIEPGTVSERYMSQWTNGLEKLAAYADRPGNVIDEITLASTEITNYLTRQLTNSRVELSQPAINKEKGLSR